MSLSKMTAAALDDTDYTIDPSTVGYCFYYYSCRCALQLGIYVDPTSLQFMYVMLSKLSELELHVPDIREKKKMWEEKKH